MSSIAIVEHLDVFKYICSRQIACFEYPFANTLIFHPTAERIRYRIIPTITSTAHTGFKMVGIIKTTLIVTVSADAELLFEVFSQRYGRGSLLMTSNLPFDEWTEVLG